ncbi:MAG: hypothetical protein AAF629_11780 [Chloroflexota bacterium]
MTQFWVAIYIDFFDDVEKQSERIQADDSFARPTAVSISQQNRQSAYSHELVDGKLTYWAHILLLAEGLQVFDTLVVRMSE